MIKNKSNIKINKDLQMTFWIIASALVYSVAITNFSKVGGIYPGGFAGLSRIITDVIYKYWKIEIPFGFLYLLEVISVMMQVSYYKLTKGKRIFKMAPLHHHFEIIYNSEKKALKLMILIQILSCILGLIIFKIIIIN